jgi:hypothetical protein
MRSKLFEKIIKINREVGTEIEELDGSMIQMKKILSDKFERYFRGPDGRKIIVTQRGFNEFFDGVSRVLSGESHFLPGASKIMKQYDSEIIPEVLASVELLPDVFDTMKKIKYIPNQKKNKNDVRGLEYYESKVYISGVPYKMNICMLDLFRRDTLEYYFHTLRERSKNQACYIISMRFDRIS